MPTSDVKHGVGHGDRREEGRGCLNVWEEEKKTGTEIFAHKLLCANKNVEKKGKK